MFQLSVKVSAPTFIPLPVFTCKVLGLHHLSFLVFLFLFLNIYEKHMTTPWARLAEGAGIQSRRIAHVFLPGLVRWQLLTVMFRDHALFCPLVFPNLVYDL